VWWRWLWLWQALTERGLSTSFPADGGVL
jgi:hypothetical protein